MEKLHDLTIQSFHEGLKNKEFTALEITEAFFSYIEDRDKEIGAYLTLLQDDAKKRAEEIDSAVAKREAINPLAGVPLAIKDNIVIEGHRTTAASKILADYIASYDATVIKNLKTAGSVFLGKTNLDEFAMGASTENSAMQKTKNPHDTSRVPGGSSGGSAAAVAGHMAVAALGTDTGGSIRQPAAFCGLVGLRPTYGAVSRHGVIAMASSLDQVGPLAKTVDDAALIFNTIKGQDRLDATSVPASYNEELTTHDLGETRKLTIGIPDEYFTDGVEESVMNAVQGVIDDIKSLNIEFKKISLPHTRYGIATYYIVVPAEVSSNLARFDGIRYARIPEVEGGSLLKIYEQQKNFGYGNESKRRIILGTFVLSSGYYDAYYAKAQKVRMLIKKDFDAAFKDVDVILTPTTPTQAFKLGDKADDPLAMYLADIFAVPASLAGLPALTVPVKPTKTLPIGFQLIGKKWREKDLFDIGHCYEQLHRNKEK
ncbi:MAG: Asp-tRNA(Asn)/Glu-tRNA(Gln) amidotransferase GatCAB subunit A [Candidatus Harrisonbacteria bacterium CG10_big_fil_rev_8_21_14_0_10_42_17]|uniref:Glutamyl-tRNA(Gln) amidotransferase subunit A n=1 Tax=Candidatus Harrisonbacteria bacterium CG10_big_fil_rev_8_21_14_0_10_42_17 TaxID=1974584 RepID=A0A2M6WHB9_9BACT|nr:MAG: Asp-tRNA(Asn)/Glu-tRNA(Gln) amidotransferase GatCAB subunit A [Candidatus Harrisonbacteria bacterium CG10_big_fil_rev_8_21_14_0_10_42_17]